MQKKAIGMNVSGSTIPSNNIIYLTRKEEITKLLFHEMIHYIGLDEYLYNSNNTFTLEWNIVNTQLLFNEAYTEFLSVVIHSAYQSVYINNVIFDNKNDAFLLYESLFKYEIIHSFLLCCKILDFYGYNETNCQDFFNSDKKMHDQPILLWEYIFLRTMLMIKFEDVLFDDKNYTIDTNNSKKIYQIFSDDTTLKEMIKNLFQYKNILNDSISYILIDIDWNKKKI
jgi:hypothetical protein